MGWRDRQICLSVRTLTLTPSSMFTPIYFWILYRAYLRHPQGTKRFAEHALGLMLERTTRRARGYRERNENLLVEKSSLREQQRELAQQPLLNASAWFGIQRRFWANRIVSSLALAGGTLLVFIALTRMLEPSALGNVAWVLVGLIASALVGGASLVAERLFEGLFADEASAERLPWILWVMLLLTSLSAIVLLSHPFAFELAVATRTWLAYAGVMGFTLLSPLMAGAARWDALRFLEIYRTTRAVRENEIRLGQIDSILRQTEEFESSYYKVQLLACWDLINGFYTVKGRPRRKDTVVESLDEHFAGSFERFQTEAALRYDADLRDYIRHTPRHLKNGSHGPSKLEAAPVPHPVVTH